MNIIIAGSNKIHLRKVNVKLYGFYKIYMDKDLREDKLYKWINQFNDRKVTPVKIHSMVLNEIQQLYNRHGKTCKILFSNDNKLNKLTAGTKIKKLII